MKSIFRYIIFAAVALSAVLAACSKDTVVGSNPDAAEGNQGLRTIILQFSPDTKVAFSGTKAEFQNGDVIKVANATQSEDATVQVSGGIASITTALTGPLTAVFPSTAANVSGNGPLGDPQFKVKAQQNGTSDDAVIAVAQIEGKNAVFELKTALFQIAPPSTANKIIIKSLKAVVNGVARTGTAAEINTDGTDKTVITVGDGIANLSSPIYVAFKPGVNLTDLSFDAGETIGIKGIPANKLDSNPDETVARGKYTIDNTNWHPYVIIGGLKWATMNVGATAETGTGTSSYGKYFAWGDTEGQTWNGSTWSNGGFNSAPDINNSTTLPLENDAAYANWGGPWRMPTGGSNGEFIALENASGISKTFNTSVSPKRYEITETSSGKTLYFSAAGYGKTTSINYSGSAGCYWSSTLKSTGDAYGLFFESGTFNPQGNENISYGRSIRPVADL